ncbi:MAG: hypothetical protein LBI04_01755 [Treponema sp.]|jgi:hypothetical protein|nr:hypothetical protein [Treponema sp.]
MKHICILKKPLKRGCATFSLSLSFDDKELTFSCDSALESWCVLDKENMQKLFTAFGIPNGNDDEVTKAFIERFGQAEYGEEVDNIFHEFKKFCDEHNIKYTYNSYFN